MITLTDAAKKHILNVLKEQAYHYLMFGVKGGGCAGFEYEWKPVYKMEPDANDFVLEIEPGYYIVVDSISQIHVIGSTIDYVSSMLNSQIVVDNPLAKSSCGCGVSFNV